MTLYCICVQIFMVTCLLVIGTPSLFRNVLPEAICNSCLPEWVWKARAWRIPGKYSLQNHFLNNTHIHAIRPANFLENTTTVFGYWEYPCVGTFVV